MEIIAKEILNIRENNAEKYVSHNFKVRELRCPCCKQMIINETSINKLQDLRDKIRRPIILTSAYRCWKHHTNIYISHFGKDWDKHITKQSAHLYGHAFDIIVKTDNELTREILIAYIKQCGFTGVGLANTFIHIDDKHKKYTEWRY